MNREEAAFRINMTQKQLEGKYGVDKKEANMDQGKTGIPSLFDLSIPMPTELIHDGNYFLQLLGFPGGKINF